MQQDATANFVSSSAPRRRIVAVASGVLIVCFALLIVSLLTAKNNRTIFGPILGGDWPAFHVAATILNQHEPSRLYDFAFQSKLYHQLLPTESPQVSLPYANAPLVANAFRPLARLPYAWSYAAWTAISFTVFLIALLLACAASELPRKHWSKAILAGLSFEPLVIENLHGGQISSVGLLAICAAVFLHLQNQSLLAGIALSICIYKPTLLPIILPMLLIARQWRVIGGFVFGVLGLSILSIWLMGFGTCIDYLRTLLNYASLTAADRSIFRTWKFIDLNSFLKLLHVSPAVVAIVWAAVLTGLIRIAIQIWNRRTHGNEDLRLIWALALCGTLVVNIYVGIYDCVLILPAILLTIGVILREDRSLAEPLVVLLSLLYILPWCSQFIACEAGVQPMTVGILMLAAIVHRRIVGFARESDNLKVSSMSTTMIRV